MTNTIHDLKLAMERATVMLALVAAECIEKGQPQVLQDKEYMAELTMQVLAFREKNLGLRLKDIP